VAKESFQNMCSTQVSKRLFKTQLIELSKWLMIFLKVPLDSIIKGEEGTTL